MENVRPIGEFTRFVQVLQDEIIPLLEEYCYEDYSALAEILGDDLVDATNQVVRRELFEDSRRVELVQALSKPYPDIAASRHRTRLPRRCRYRFLESHRHWGNH
jgi:5-methylcytosine-specific restriction protein B